jgi:Mg2+ and Co2+ transporter CorA
MVFRARGTTVLITGKNKKRYRTRPPTPASRDWETQQHGRFLLLTIYRDTSGSVRSSNEQELPGEVIWIDLLNPTDDEKAFVEARAHVRIPSMEALSEIESSSRLIVEG